MQTRHQKLLEQYPFLTVIEYASSEYLGIMQNIDSHVASMYIYDRLADEKEKMKLFKGLDNYDCIRKKGDWAIKWINDKKSNFATRLIAFACVEGIFFSGAFCSIFWLKKRGLMPGLTLSNEFISRDEALHTEFAILLYTKLEKQLSKKKIRNERNK